MLLLITLALLSITPALNAQTSIKEKIIGNWILYPNTNFDDTVNLVRLEELKTFIGAEKLNPRIEWELQPDGVMWMHDSYSNKKTTAGIINENQPEDTIVFKMMNGDTVEKTIYTYAHTAKGGSFMWKWKLTDNEKNLEVTGFKIDDYEIASFTETHITLIRKK